MVKKSEFQCTICKKYYATHQSLCNHTKNIHGLTPTGKLAKNKKIKIISGNNKSVKIEENNIKPIDTINKYNCNYCDNAYKYKQSRTKHLKTCQGKTILTTINELEKRIIELTSKNNNLEKKLNDINKIPQTENIIIENTEANTTNIKIKNKKHVPKLLKNQSWDVYIGKEKGVGNCFCCNTEIDSKHFECGHVIPISKGGPDTIENLRPICSLCNRSMGSKNMAEFMKKYLNKQFNPII